MKKDNKATFYIFIGSADEGAVKHLSNTCNTFVRMCHSAVCSCFASGHLLSVNLQRVHYLWIYVYIYRFDSIGALHIHVMHSLPTYCFWSLALLFVFAIATHTVLCSGHYCKFSLPSMYLAPCPSLAIIGKNEDIFIGGGHVMPHSQPIYVLEFSHARIQLVQTLISTFLS